MEECVDNDVEMVVSFDIVETYVSGDIFLVLKVEGGFEGGIEAFDGVGGEGRSEDECYVFERRIRNGISVWENIDLFYHVNRVSRCVIAEN